VNHVKRGVPSLGEVEAPSDWERVLAVLTNEMMERLTTRGIDWRVFSAGVLDHERETSRDEVLATLEPPVRRFP
jgi:hypothetical protein